MDTTPIRLRPPPPAASRFATTHWSVVLTAADPASAESRAAFGALYQSYSLPLYGFVRRRGYSPADAQDLLHGFFESLIARNYLQTVVRERGRFRAFLLGSLRHFLANDWNRNHRAKRGGQAAILSLDRLLEDSERPFHPMAAAEPVEPEVLFDREWARALIARVLQGLRREWEEGNRTRQFEELRFFLTRPGDGKGYREAGAALGMSAGAVKLAVHRLRLRFRERLHREVASTVGPAGDVEDELRHLVRVLRKEW